MNAGFGAGEERWRAGLGTLRQVVRQEVVTRQLGAHVPVSPSLRVLDIGCGQGTQALQLARRGHLVTGLDSSQRALGDFRAALEAAPDDVRDHVTLVRGDAGAVGDLFQPQSFDVVLCHGVLMYFPDPAPLLDAIARVTAIGGLVSLLVRNGDGLAMRPGLLGDWGIAERAFDEDAYLNRLGLHARADRLSDLVAALGARGLSVSDWYGVRVFTDIEPSDAPLPDEATLDVLLRCEERAGRTDPYRRVAALLHIIAGTLRASGGDMAVGHSAAALETDPQVDVGAAGVGERGDLGRFVVHRTVHRSAVAVAERQACHGAGGLPSLRGGEPAGGGQVPHAPVEPVVPAPKTGYRLAGRQQAPG